MYRYKITIGDYSRDGHNKFDDFIVCCTHPKTETEKAYKKAVKASKVDLYKECCEYEDGAIDSDKIDKLVSVGADVSDIELDGYGEEGEVVVYPESMVKLYLEMVKSQLPKFDYIIENTETLVKGLGYGLYN